MLGFFGSRPKIEHPAREQERSVIPRSKSCLVIDGSGHVLELFSAVLSPLRVDFVVSQDVDEAIDLIPHFAPSLIFLAVRLKGGDAFDVMNALQRMRYRGGVQLMSGRHKEHLASAFKIGEQMGLRMLTPLEKPFRPGQIRNIIREERLVAETLSIVSIPFREASESGWIEVWYQPQIDMRNRTVYGAEALVRARHPVHGPTAAGAFLADASAADIVALTCTVVRDACGFWSTLREQGLNLSISVNADLETLQAPAVRRALDESLPKHPDFPGLCFEVDAADLFKDLKLAERLSAQLRIYKASIVVANMTPREGDMLRLLADDLKQVKLSHALAQRVDKENLSWRFFRDLQDYADRSGCRLCADGVEIQKQADILLGDGVSCAQGVLFAPSLDKTEFMAELKRRLRDAQPAVQVHEAPQMTVLEKIAARAKAQHAAKKVKRA